MHVVDDIDCNVKKICLSYNTNPVTLIYTLNSEKSKIRILKCKWLNYYMIDNCWCIELIVVYYC